MGEIILCALRETFVSFVVKKFAAPASEYYPLNIFSKPAQTAS
jgi:hypothetical protein